VDGDELMFVVRLVYNQRQAQLVTATCACPEEGARWTRYGNRLRLTVMDGWLPGNVDQAICAIVLEFKEFRHLLVPPGVTWNEA